MDQVEGPLRDPAWARGFLLGLDLLLKLGEKIAILFVVGLVAYTAFQLFFGHEDPAQTRSGKILELIDDNWKATLLVTALFFYRPIRDLLRRIRRIRAQGVELETEVSSDDSPSQSGSERGAQV